MESAVQMLGQVAGCCRQKMPLLLMDAHRPYPAAILQVFGQVMHRRRRKGHERGRLKKKGLKPPPGLMAGVVDKVRDAAGNLLRVKTHALFGRLKDIRRRIRKFKLGVGINTAHVERFNGTARGRLARLARKTRDVSRRGTPLREALALCRDIYNWVHPHGALDGASSKPPSPSPWPSLASHAAMGRHARGSPRSAAIWAEEQEIRIRSPLDVQNGLKVLPTSGGTTKS